MQVLPNRWLYSLLAYETPALGGLAYVNLTNPLGNFKDSLPPSYDKETDDLRSSARVELAGGTNALVDGLALGLVYASILFAKSDLAGQPVLQETLMPRVVGILTVADPVLLGIVAFRLPGELRRSPSKWNSSLKGLFYGVPMGIAFKVAYLMGLGRGVAL